MVVGMFEDFGGLIVVQHCVPIAEEKLPIDLVGEFAKERLHFVAAMAIDDTILRTPLWMQDFTMSVMKP